MKGLRLHKMTLIKAAWAFSCRASESSSQHHSFSCKGAKNSLSAAVWVWRGGVGAAVCKVHSYKPHSTSLSLTSALQGNEPHPACGQPARRTNHSSGQGGMDSIGRASGCCSVLHLFIRLWAAERRKHILNRQNKLQKECKKALLYTWKWQKRFFPMLKEQVHSKMKIVNSFHIRLSFFPPWNTKQ